MALGVAEMSALTTGIRRLIDWADAELGPGDRWRTPDGYSGVGYAIIDAVMAARQDYDVKVVPMMASLQSNYGADSVDHNIPWLLGLFDEVAANTTGDDRGRALASNLFANHTKIGGQYKGIVMEFLAKRLAAYQSPAIPKGLGSDDDWDPLRALGPAARGERRRLREAIGGPSGIAGVGEATSRYLQILLRCPEVKPDQHTKWFFCQHSGTSESYSDSMIADYLVDACEHAIGQGWTTHGVRDIDYLMWCCKSKHRKHPVDGLDC
jgi:hypothetical protein